MSTYKKLKRDCMHERGYNEKTNRCPDCNTLALPTVQIEHTHQQLLQGYIMKEQGEKTIADGQSVQVPDMIMVMTRITAIEIYLNQKAKAEEAAQGSVTLQ